MIKSREKSLELLVKCIIKFSTVSTATRFICGNPQSKFTLPSNTSLVSFVLFVLTTFRIQYALRTIIFAPKLLEYKANVFPITDTAGNVEVTNHSSNQN